MKGIKLKLFAVFIISTVCFALSEVENGGVKGENAGCLGLCNEFVSFIYDVIQQKAFFNGAVPASNLYGLIKWQASEFCKKNYENSKECQKLVKKTWMIVVSLETGANIDDVCSEINICNAGKPPVKSVKTTNLTEYTMGFCTEWRRNTPDSGKFCASFSATIKSVVSSLVVAAQSGNVMSEISNCLPGTHTFGCYIKQAPPHVKMMVVLLTSMMPSPTALKRKIQDRYLAKPGSLCLFADRGGNDKKAKTEDSALNHETCRSTCDIIAKKLASSYLKDSDFIQNHQKVMVTACQIFNVTQPEKCDNMALHFTKLLAGFFTQMVHQFCFNNVCSTQEITFMRSKMQENCKKPVFSNVKFENVDAAISKSGVDTIKATGVVWVLGLFVNMIFGIW